MDDLLIIDVEPRAGFGTSGSPDAPVVVVEPLLGGPAVVAALDVVDEVSIAAGSGDVPHIGHLLDGNVPDGDRQLRVTDLMHALDAEAALGADDAILVSYLNLRPCAALLGAWATGRDNVTRIRIACAAVQQDSHAIGADAMHLAGALARLLLEEIDRPVMLSEAAGIAMTVAQSAEQAESVLEAGRRWALLRGDIGVDPATPHLAGQADMCAAVPLIHLRADEMVAAAWRPQELQS